MLILLSSVYNLSKEHQIEVNNDNLKKTKRTEDEKNV